jgi:Tol biopolymer transport system component
MTRRNVLLVTAASLMALAVLIGIPGHGVVGSAYPSGTAKGGGTILFENQNHWYTIAPNGTHLHMLVSDTAGCVTCAVFSPDGTRIMLPAYTAGKKRVTTAIINTNGSGYHALPLPDRALNLGPGAWAPGGTRVALEGWDVARKSRFGVYAVNASNGGRLVRLTTSPDGHGERPIAYSPDGSRLLFFHEGTPISHDLPLFGDLYETTATGSGRIKLNPRGTSVTADFGLPASWSPDGKQIAFVAFSSPASVGDSAVFTTTANGTHPRRIISWGQWSTSSLWSPDGAWIVFDKVQPNVVGGPHRVYVVHPNGTGLKAITSLRSVGPAGGAVWSPDGNKLLFGGKGANLWTANRDGSKLVRLTHRDPNREPGGYAWGR